MCCRSVLYGRLGVCLAHAVVSSVLPPGGMWSAARGLLPLHHAVVNQSAEMMGGWAACLESSNQISVPPPLTAPNAIRQLAAVSIALSAST